MPGSTEPYPKLSRTPIIEAIVSIGADCPGFDLPGSEEAACKVWLGDYPKKTPTYLSKAEIAFPEAAPASISAAHAHTGFNFHASDGLQVLQIRRDGFSFNRLAPYTTLDDYLPEIRQRWEEYCAFAKPVGVRHISLRFINKILIPDQGGKIHLHEYFKDTPQLLDPREFEFTGFLHQQELRHLPTGLLARLVMTGQPWADGLLPILFDITVTDNPTILPDSPSLWSTVETLRKLKNKLFFQNLTEKCLSLFQYSPPALPPLPSV